MRRTVESAFKIAIALCLLAGCQTIDSKGDSSVQDATQKQYFGLISIHISVSPELYEERFQEGEKAQDFRLIRTGVSPELYEEVLKEGEKAKEELDRLRRDQSLSTTAKLILAEAKEAEEQGDVATSLNNLALLYQSQGRYEEAEVFFIQALGINRKHLGEEHPQVATSLNNLALLYQSQGRYKEAELFYRQALYITRKQLGAEHPQIAIQLNNLAALYESKRRYESAEAFYRQALKINRKRLGAEHPQVAIQLNNLAFLNRKQGKYEEAESLYLQALEIDKSYWENNILIPE